MRDAFIHAQRENNTPQLSRFRRIYCQAEVRSAKVQSPKVKTKGTWADTKISWAITPPHPGGKQDLGHGAVLHVQEEVYHSTLTFRRIVAGYQELPSSNSTPNSISTSTQLYLHFK